jgi:hypothetical protein
MGLDMYLEKRTYVRQWSHQTPEEQFEVVVKKGGVTYPNIDPKKVKYIIEEAGYWRKANAIHRWFVENIQDGIDNCGDYYVDSSSLETLLDLCEKVKTNHELADELLPCAEGFFFGDTEYDEWYFNGIDNTIDIIKKALEDTNTADFYYTSSW